ncbi:MAG TPA: M28 family peptidase, partial [Bacteroidia bacterium]
AGVIELARYFSQNKRQEKFNFLFICFSGEELGLYGSKKYCDNPTVDFSKVNYMINMDMIGRLVDSTKKLMLYGVGTSADWIPLLDKTNPGFRLVKDSSGIGPSDQTSFYLKNIPVLHFFTGQHSDYHKPSDDWKKINFVGEEKVLEYIIKVIEETESFPKMKFLETKNHDSGKSNFKVTLGIMPDYTFEGKGLRVDGVTKGKPADGAGILKGDIIIQLGDIAVNNMENYMKALSQFKKGETTDVTVKRGEKEIKMKVTF